MNTNHRQNIVFGPNLHVGGESSRGTNSHKEFNPFHDKTNFSLVEHMIYDDEQRICEENFPPDSAMWCVSAGIIEDCSMSTIVSASHKEAGKHEVSTAKVMNEI